eukprot:TRINITY_DN7445_c1_g1_i3.p1 TRINITY_DN7445_c1_g1~~TRINITY_DN7445_c1_g1_i3.p1  ORF type:complete len:834 (-),score=92.53 TRINITY_DN7445_c1_g1_i3:704-3037(-)
MSAPNQEDQPIPQLQKERIQGNVSQGPNNNGAWLQDIDIFDQQRAPSPQIDVPQISVASPSQSSEFPSTFPSVSTMNPLAAEEAPVTGSHTMVTQFAPQIAQNTPVSQLTQLPASGQLPEGLTLPGSTQLPGVQMAPTSYLPTQDQIPSNQLPSEYQIPYDQLATQYQVPSSQLPTQQSTPSSQLPSDQLAPSNLLSAQGDQQPDSSQPPAASIQLPAAAQQAFVTAPPPASSLQYQQYVSANDAYQQQEQVLEDNFAQMLTGFLDPPPSPELMVKQLLASPSPQGYGTKEITTSFAPQAEQGIQPYLESLPPFPPMPSPPSGMDRGWTVMDRVLTDGRSPMQLMVPTFSLEMSPDSQPAQNAQVSTVAPADPSITQTGCENQSALDIIKSEPDLSALHLAIIYNGMEDIFNDPTVQMTVFAPNNNAFQELSREQSAGELPVGDTGVNVMQDKELMSMIINYHVIWQQKISYDSLKTMQDEMLDTLGGAAQIGFIGFQDIVLLKGVGNNGAITDMDVGGTCNTAMHIIDSVLLPFNLNTDQGTGNSSNASLTTGTGTQRSALNTQPPPRNPTNLPQIDSADVSPQLPNTKAINESSMAPGAAQDVPTWARAPVCTPLLSVLSQQPELALYHQFFVDYGLPEVLRDQTNITLFAPSDSAMGDLLKLLDVSDSDSGSSPFDYQTMITLLSSHIIYGNWHSQSLQQGMELQTFASNDDDTPLMLTVQRQQSDQQQPPAILLTGPQNTVNVLRDNRVACGSILHVVDGVLLPPGVNNLSRP